MKSEPESNDGSGHAIRSEHGSVSGHGSQSKWHKVQVKVEVGVAVEVYVYV